MDEDPWTCGLGLASRSTLPGKLGELLAASASILENHMRALDPTDADARTELDAYAVLVTRQRDVAEQLSGIADQMAGYRTLPMETTMSDPAALAAFAEFVRLEREVVTWLQGLLQEDEQMLQEMTGTG